MKDRQEEMKKRSKIHVDKRDRSQIFILFGEIRLATGGSMDAR